MNPCLADVNVWLALSIQSHIHFREAKNWFDRLGPGEGGWCRAVQLSVARHLANPAVVGADALSISNAWDLIRRAGEDQRVELVSDPQDFDSRFPALLRQPGHASKLIADAYLAALAMGSGRKLVTFDKGFRQFKELDLLLLGR